MFEYVYRLSDPATGLWYQGDTPATFTATPIDFPSKKAAMTAYGQHVRYELGLVKPKRPLHLKLHEIKVELIEQDTSTIKPSDVPGSCAKALFWRRCKSSPARTVFTHVLMNNQFNDVVAILRTTPAHASQIKRDHRDVLAATYGNWLAVTTWAGTLSIIAAFDVREKINLEDFRKDLDGLV